MYLNPSTNSPFTLFAVKYKMVKHSQSVEQAPKLDISINLLLKLHFKNRCVDQLSYIIISIMQYIYDTLYILIYCDTLKFEETKIKSHRSNRYSWNPWIQTRVSPLQFSHFKTEIVFWIQVLTSASLDFYFILE